MEERRRCAKLTQVTPAACSRLRIQHHKAGPTGFSLVPVSPPQALERVSCMSWCLRKMTDLSRILIVPAAAGAECLKCTTLRASISCISRTPVAEMSNVWGICGTCEAGDHTLQTAQNTPDDAGSSSADISRSQRSTRAWQNDGDFVSIAMH